MHDLVAIVDAFTDTPFAGNPAAVCLLTRERDDIWLQAFAREMNMPATAFISRAAAGYHLRWFATSSELTLCGHGTLASAHLLWQEGWAAPGETVRFSTVAGPLGCRQDDGWVVMDFPAEVPQPVETPPDLLESLGVTPLLVARNRLDYLVVLDNAAAVRALQPDLVRLATVPTRGVIITAPADLPGYDCISRFFAPRVAINEDLATGSAHCALGPYWGARLGKDDLLGYQASSRGGTIRMRLRAERVDLLGQATTVLRGTIAR